MSPKPPQLDDDPRWRDLCRRAAANNDVELDTAYGIVQRHYALLDAWSQYRQQASDRVVGFMLDAAFMAAAQSAEQGA